MASAKKTSPNPCAPRRRFASEGAVKAASLSVAAKYGVLRLPEPCSKCNGWHLSEIQRGKK